MADKTFEVNGRIYVIDRIPPDVAFSFGLKATKVIAPMLSGLKDITDRDSDKWLSLLSSALSGIDTDRTEELCKIALDYVITPDNTYMKNAAIRFEWFTKYPEDLMLVPLMAVTEIARDFLLPTLTTLATKLRPVESALKSPKVTKPQ